MFKLVFQVQFCRWVWFDSDRTIAPTPSLRVAPLALTLGLIMIVHFRKSNYYKAFKIKYSATIHLLARRRNPQRQLWQAIARVRTVSLLRKRAESTLWSYFTGNAWKVPWHLAIYKIQTCDFVIMSRYQETCSDDNMLERTTNDLYDNQKKKTVQLQIFSLYRTRGWKRHGKEFALTLFSTLDYPLLLQY